MEKDPREIPGIDGLQIPRLEGLSLSPPREIDIAKANHEFEKDLKKFNKISLLQEVKIE